MDCADFAWALVGEDDDDRERAARHAAGCASCAALLAADTEIAELAAAWRRSAPAPPPGMRGRLRSKLVRRGLIDGGASGRPGAGTRRTVWAALAAALLGLALLLPSRPRPTEGESLQAALLRVERAERAYAGAIAALERRAGPVLERADDPTLDAREAARLMRYRDRLGQIDAAIAEVRAFLDEHPGHARGRAVLLAAYETKSSLLREILELPRGERS